MKKLYLKLNTWNYSKGNVTFTLGLLITLFFFSGTVDSQTIRVTGTENNTNISKVNLTVGSSIIEQNNPTGNENPSPSDAPVLIKSVLLENGKELFVTTRKPEITKPHPLIGSEQISESNVEIINSNKASVGHRDPNFIPNLTEVVSTPDLRSYWSIGSQPSIPVGESFVDLRYPFPSSGYIMFSERNGNSGVDFIALGTDGKPIPGATTVQVRGYQWNTGVNHSIDIPSQKQWLVVFSPSLFNTLLPVDGVRVVSINEPDGKLVFFVGSLSAAPDNAGPISNQNESKAVLNVFENDELNEAAVQPFDVDLSVITPFPENTLMLNEDGTVDVPANTPPGTYTMTYQLTDVVGGESDQATVTVRVHELMPEANDDNISHTTVTGADSVINVLDNDLLNGIPAILDNVILSEISNNTNGTLILNPDGSLDVTAGAQPGVYQLTYQICDQANASKCDTALVTVYIEVSQILAVDDNFGNYLQNGHIGNVLLNDKLNGIPVGPSQVEIVVTDNGGLTDLIVDKNGMLRLPVMVAPGNYVLTYELSETLDPTNNDLAEVRFTVKQSSISLINDFAETSQNQSIDIAVLDNDTSESGTFNLSTLSITIPAANGTATVNEDGTIAYLPASDFGGEDSFTYSVCDGQDSGACDTAVVTVTVPSQSVDLSITKSSLGAEIYQGNEFIYEIQVINAGNTDASNVVITDNLPSGLTYVSSSSTASTGEIEDMATVNGNTITWTVATLPAGETLTINLAVKADQLGSKINNVEVTTNEHEELTPADNMDQDINEVLEFFIPNVFSPSAKDNKNDRFEIKGIEEFASNKLVIFNRWGDHVFEAEDYQNNWEAESLSSGSYFYVLEVTDSSGKKQTFQGWVQVIKD